MSCDGQLMQQLVWWRLLNRNNKECELCLKAETLSPKQRKIASHMAEILLIFLGFDFLFLLYSAINFGSDQERFYLSHFHRTAKKARFIKQADRIRGEETSGSSEISALLGKRLAGPWVHQWPLLFLLSYPGVPPPCLWSGTPSLGMPAPAPMRLQQGWAPAPKRAAQCCPWAPLTQTHLWSCVPAKT